MHLRKTYLNFLAILICISALILQNEISAQSLSRFSISGRVINSATGMPIANTNVSVAFTMMGSSTDVDGSFEINGVIPGKYTLIVSHVGFQNQSKELQISSASIKNLSFELTPKLYQLPDVKIQDDFPTEWFYNFRTFKTQLLGRSSNAQKSEILNPYIIDFSRSKDETLIAKADEPLIIINNSLGYKITYRLDYFEFAPKYVKYSGVPLFQEIAPESDEQKQLWSENRARVYNGSLRHFLTLLCDKSVNTDTLLMDQLFVVHGVGKQIDDSNSPFNIVKNISGFVSAGADPFSYKLSFDNYWEIVYRGELEDEELVPLSDQPGFENSWIKLEADTVSIDKFGRYFDKFLIKTSGYISKERLADMLPYEYGIPERKANDR